MISPEEFDRMENMIQSVEKKNEIGSAKTDNELELRKKSTSRQEFEEGQQLFKFNPNDDAAIDIFFMKFEYILKLYLNLRNK